MCLSNVLAKLIQLRQTGIRSAIPADTNCCGKPFLYRVGLLELNFGVAIQLEIFSRSLSSSSDQLDNIARFTTAMEPQVVQTL